MDFGRLLTAMVTPFNKEGKINFEVTTSLVEHLIKTGTEGLVVSGTTGESPTLTVGEKISLFEHVIKVVNKRIPVIAGTGSYDTAASIHLTKKAEELGADGVMLVTPYYSKPNQRGLYAHFSAIANKTNLPIMLYNIPGRSIINMSAETTIALSKIENIVCIKEASGDLDQASIIIQNTSDDFHVYSGDDGMTVPMLSIGGKGVVSVSSHIIGQDMVKMIDSYEQGEVTKAAAIHRKILPIVQGLFKAPSPTPVKAALVMQGINVGNARLPLTELSEAEHSELKAILKR